MTRGAGVEALGSLIGSACRLGTLHPRHKRDFRKPTVSAANACVLPYVDAASANNQSRTVFTAARSAAAGGITT